MQISVNIPNEWVELIDKTAANECHRSRATVIRQVLKKHFIDPMNQQTAQNETNNKALQEASAK